MFSRKCYMGTSPLNIYFRAFSSYLGQAEENGLLAAQRRGTLVNDLLTTGAFGCDTNRFLRNKRTH